MKFFSPPTYLRALLLVSMSCFGSASVHAAGTQPSTSAYATIQPNLTGTSYVYTISYVAGDDGTNGYTTPTALGFEGTPFGNAGAALDDVTLLGGGDWFQTSVDGTQKVAYRTTVASTSGLHTQNVNTLPNTNILVNWQDPLITTIGLQGPSNATPQWNDMGTFLFHDVLIYGSGIQGVTGVFNPNNPTSAGATVGLGVGIATDVDGGVLDDLGFMVVGYNDATQTVRDNIIPRKGYVQVVVPNPTAQETATVGAGVAQVETLTLSGTATAARAQVETATVVAPSNITTAGNVSVTVTGALITGSPLVVTTANVALNATASTVATAIRTAMNAAGLSGAITNNYTVGGTGAIVTLTKKSAFTPNDGTLNIAIANGTCAGITAAPTSTNTTSGIGVGQTGTLNIVVTAANMTGSPKTIPVTITAGNTTAQQTVLAVTALNADPDVSAFFTASGTTTVILTAKNAASDDATMNVASSPVDIIGPVAVATSVNTTAGYAIGAGNAAITVTGANIVGSPLAVNVALLATDTSSAAATKIRAALSALPAITNFYTVGGTGAQVTLTKSAAPLNAWDSTLNIAIANGTTTGLTENATSAGTDGFTDRFIPGVHINNPAIELTVTTNAAYTPKIAVSGDFDSDLDVDAADLTVAATGYAGAGVTGKFYRNGDVNADGDADNADLGLVIGAFAAAPGTPLTPTGSATLTYDPLTGNVKLDATTATGSKITSFQLQTSAATIVTANYTPVTGGNFNGTYKNVTTSVIGDTDTSLAGVTGSAIDLGNVFPTGMDLTQLTAYLTTRVYTGASGTAQQQLTLAVASAATLDHFEISAIASPQTVGTAITGITLTARDASNATFTGFTGTVNFGGTAGVTGTSGTFVLGVLSGVSVTPANASSNLTFTVTDPVSGKTGSQTIATIQTQYQAWAGGADFNADTNGDGVKNGLAWLLGASDKNVSALGKLPTVTQSGGDLILNFNCLPVASRGTASLKLAHSNSLGSWTATANVVPDADNAVPDNNVTFVVGAGPAGPPALKSVTATIDSAAASGKLFGRLEATQP